ncbi:MAG: hypothetical protein LKF74_03790 [Megasphaera sp.]|nr:hypothetical protein [Megasphaera sp.]
MEQRTDYMTTKEAAAMWDVFLRQVQRLLAKKKRLFQAALEENLAQRWKTTFAGKLIFIHELLHDGFGKCVLWNRADK